MPNLLNHGDTLTKYVYSAWGDQDLSASWCDYFLVAGGARYRGARIVTCRGGLWGGSHLGVSQFGTDRMINSTIVDVDETERLVSDTTHITSTIKIYKPIYTINRREINK